MSDSKLEYCVTCGEETELMFQGIDCLEKIIYVHACSYNCANEAFTELECIYVFDEQGFAWKKKDYFKLKVVFLL